MASPVLLYAVHAAGVQSLPVPAQAANAHEVFDDLPLGVYTGLRSFGRERFLGLEAHLERTERCLRLSGWEYELDRRAVRRALDEVIRSYPSDAFVRLDILPEAPTQLGTDSRTLLALSQVVELPAHFFQEGVNVEVAEGLERRDPSIKTADFVIERRPFPLNRQDCFEHLLLDTRGNVLEGTSSNIYLVSKGVVRTSQVDMLAGITRLFVLRLCRELDLPVRLEAPPLSEVLLADEAFLSSSTRGLVPVVSLAGQAIGDGHPGPITKRLTEAYRALLAREARPAWPPPMERVEG